MSCAIWFKKFEICIGIMRDVLELWHYTSHFELNMLSIKS